MSGEWARLVSGGVEGASGAGRLPDGSQQESGFADGNSMDYSVAGSLEPLVARTGLRRVGECETCGRPPHQGEVPRMELDGQAQVLAKPDDPEEAVPKLSEL